MRVGAPVLHQNTVDKGLVQVEHRGVPLGPGHLGREVVHRDMLASRRLRDPRPAMDFRVGQPLVGHLPYILIIGMPIILPASYAIVSW